MQSAVSINDLPYKLGRHNWASVAFATFYSHCFQIRGEILIFFQHSPHSHNHTTSSNFGTFRFFGRAFSHRLFPSYHSHSLAPPHSERSQPGPKKNKEVPKFPDAATSHHSSRVTDAFFRRFDGRMGGAVWQL